MRPTRKLTLKRETLTALTPDQMRQVVGADANGATSPVKYCITDLLTCYVGCASWQTEPC